MSLAPRALPPSVNGWNAAYVEAQYDAYRVDPFAVPADVRAYFQGFDLAASRPGAGGAAGAAGGINDAVRALVNAYRRFGHVTAKLDPFGRERGPRPAQLSLEYHGIAESQLDTQVDGTLAGLPGTASLRQVVAHLDAVYCGTIGIEFWFIESDTERDWLVDRIEKGADRPVFTPEQRREILEQLTSAETFERFLQKRYPGDKRFSLEGGETVIPMLKQFAEAASDVGVEEIVIGMAHRGRLNVLHNVMGKTREQIFTEFEDNWEAGFADGGGDVKYHRGYSGEHILKNDKTIHMALASNPSHLESVNPVVLGRTRAKQRLRADTQRLRVVPLLIHGDAALAGQGMIAECLNFSQLKGYTVGGCVHVVINNLIGFTTIPEDARSTRYCTDIAKAAECPVFHVNAEDPEACVAMMRLAIAYRQKFQKDVFVDVVCYRRYGHNEQDEQSYTQPALAALIKKQPSILDSYTKKLLDLGVIADADAKAIQKRLDDELQKASDAAKKSPYDPTIDPGGKRWAGITGDYSHKPAKTATTRGALEEVAAALGRVPEGFTLNPKLADNEKLKTEGLVTVRSRLATTDKLSHADAEMLAFGTLLLEGIPIRLSGQDARRGTFSQRHAVLRDFNTGEPFEPLNSMRTMGIPGLRGQEPLDQGADGRPRQARMCVYDSPLSEVSVMGFDYGYSLADPNMLVLWEGQFGDFDNGAQVIIDQYLASSEIKWSRWSGLVLLLPHGYEGAGPEHSSARMERFLLLCADQNMEVVVPSTGAQMFHLLRRQVKRNFRKPLIVMTPKSMLRVPTSTADDLLSGTFQEIIDDPAFAAAKAAGDRKKVKRVVLCAGKIYHELNERRVLIKREDVAIVRVEQIYPLHSEMLQDVLSQYPDTAEKVWVQEEPKNAGAWTHISDAVREELDVELHYIGRAASASPAVGSKHAHKHEQEDVIEAAIGRKPEAKLPPEPKDAGKADVKPEPKPVAKAPVAKPALKPEPKPAASPIARPTAKTNGKPAAQAKSAATAAKAIAKPIAKPAPKPTLKPTPKPVPSRGRGR